MKIEKPLTKFMSKLRKTRCNHNASATNTTLLFLSDTLMVYPPKRYAVCSICGKSFEFTEDEKGELKETNEEEKNNEKGGNS